MRCLLCTLSNAVFSCDLLPAVGDTIPINYNNKKYFIDIVEAKPVGFNT